MATLGKWSGGTVSISPGTSWAAPNGLFPTQDRNDGSAYSFTSSTSTLTLPSSDLADGYLIVAAFEYEDTSNGRHNPQGQFVQASGTGTFVSAPTSGYDRDTSEDRAYVRCWGFVDNPSASSTYQFQWKRDTDTPTGGTVRSEFQVIPLYYSNHGIYTSTTAALYGGTTPNQVTGWSASDESDTAAIELATNVVTVKGDNKRYLIFGSQFYENYGGTRTQRWVGLEIDGTKEDAAKAYYYSRNSSNDEVGEMYTWLIETVTANRTLEHFCYRGDGVSAGQGGASVDGSTPTVGDHAMVVLELNDAAEVFANIGNGGQNLATTGPVDLTVCDTTDIQFNDSASFTRASDTAMNAEQAMDALLGANISAAQNTVATGSRWTAYAELTINGTEDSDSFAGDYMRSNQSSADTFGWSANCLGFQALALNDDVGVSVTELAGTEGGGGNITSPDGWEGFWGINLDTLEDAGAGSASGNGALTSQDSTIAGSGTSQAAGDGDLSAAVSTIAGSGVSSSVGEGSLASADSTIAGEGVISWAGNGDLAADSATIAGTGISVSEGDGDLQVGAAAIAGEGTSHSLGSGDLQASAATIAGEGTRVSGESGNGDLAAGVATITGEGETRASGDGDLATAAATITAEGTVSSAGDGSLVASASAVAGSGVLVDADIVGGGDLQAGAVVITGEGTSQSAGSGDLAADAAVIAATGTSQSAGNAGLPAADSEISGSGSVIWLGEGGLEAAAAVISGSGVSRSVGNGDLAASAAGIAGSADTGITAPAGFNNMVMRRRSQMRCRKRRIGG